MQIEKRNVCLCVVFGSSFTFSCCLCSACMVVGCSETEPIIFYEFCNDIFSNVLGICGGFCVKPIVKIAFVV